jgi:hypothetical protein
LINPDLGFDRPEFPQASLRDSGWNEAVQTLLFEKSKPIDLDNAATIVRGIFRLIGQIGD